MEVVMNLLDSENLFVIMAISVILMCILAGVTKIVVIWRELLGLP